MDQTANEPCRGWKHWGPAAFSALTAVALYAVTLGGTFIYDDCVIIGVDDRVQHHLWRQFWTKDYFNGAIDNLYRPLISMSYGVEWWLHGGRAWIFHLVNVLLHAGAAALVAELGRRLVDWRVGLIAGLLFAVHPVHSEAVAGIVGRAELGCTVCVIGAMVIFLKRPMTKLRALAIFFLCAVAMLCKEQGLLMPFLLGALVFVRASMGLHQNELTKKQRHADRQALLLMFALVIWATGALIFVREEVLKLKFEWDRGFLDVAMQPMIKSPAVDRWLIPVELVGRYFQLLVAPTKLSIDYGLTVMGPTISRNDPYLWLGAGVIVLWIDWMCLSAARRWRVTMFCLLAMAITYSMASNVVIIATIFGERLVYLPSAFFLILSAMAMAKLPGKAWGILLGALLILGCIRTWTYVRRWNDCDAFYAYSLREQPKSLKLHLLLADVDRHEGRLAEARDIVADAEGLDSEYFELWKMSALIDEQAGDWDRAVADWRRAFDLSLSPAINDRLADAIRKRDELRASSTRKASASP